MVSLRQNAGLDLPAIIVPFTELDLPMFEGLPDMGGPYLTKTTSRCNFAATSRRHICAATAINLHPLRCVLHTATLEESN
jgi:hypothetical protein